MTNLIQNYGNNRADYDVFKDQIELSVRADEDGYYSIGCVEHHFDPGYSMCPDNTQFLSYLAGRTSKAKLHTTAVILPWNDPLRVVEKIALLDNLSDGRAMFGMGRGLARREYEGFGIDMNESRERFDEAAEVIIGGLENGYVENDGNFYKQKKVEIHPGALETFKGRTTMVAMSPDSAIAAGKLGIPMLAFIQGPMEQMHMPMIESYRKAFRDNHGGDAPAPMMIDLTYCHNDSEEARRVAYEACFNYYITCVEHYEFGGRHFESTRGYSSYAAAKEAIDAMGIAGVADIYANAQIWGTPEEQISKHEERRSIVGDYDVISVFQFGGIHSQAAADSYELFTREVKPKLEKL